MEKPQEATIRNLIDEEMKRLLDALSNTGADEAEYQDLLKTMKKLAELRTKNYARLVSPSDLVKGGVSIMSILLILNYEKLGVITSKAFGFVTK